MSLRKTVLLGALSVSAVHAQSSCGPSPSGGIQPSVASGYSLQVVATGLAKPRGIVLDNEGNLLVVEAGSGTISAHTIQEDSSGCISVGTSSVVTSDLDLNHGIELSPDGTILYASSGNDLFSWAYNPAARAVSGQTTLLTNMTTSDHTTRTLLLSRSMPGMIIVNRGSTSNLDFQAASMDSGHSQIKAFNLNELGGSVYDFNTDGTMLGWGLRNDVGVAEHPTTGGIWSVENSADEISRMGVDVHENNPGEELNFLGYLNGTRVAQQGSNFGYPWCFAVWDRDSLPNNAGLTVGGQFAIDADSDLDGKNQTDEYCAQQTSPRLVFQAHMAPLDIKFNNSGNQAWVSFHGSWDRSDPSGYKLSVVDFQDGEPIEASTSRTAVRDIVTNADNSRCPDHCFRPVGMAIDPQGRIYLSSDSTGEIYLVRKTSSEGSSSSSALPTTTPTRTSTSSSSGTSTGSSSSTSSASSSSITSGQRPLGKVVMALLSTLLWFFV